MISGRRAGCCVLIDASDAGPSEFLPRDGPEDPRETGREGRQGMSEFWEVIVRHFRAPGGITDAFRIGQVLLVTVCWDCEHI